MKMNWKYFFNSVCHHSFYCSLHKQIVRYLRREIHLSFAPKLKSYIKHQSSKNIDAFCGCLCIDLPHIVYRISELWLRKTNVKWNNLVLLLLLLRIRGHYYWNVNYNFDLIKQTKLHWSESNLFSQLIQFSKIEF